MVARNNTGLGSIIDDIMTLIPMNLDRYLGNMATPQVIEQSGGLLGNATATRYVDNIGQRVMSKSDKHKYGYTFDIINNDAPNAFALPNGLVAVTTGLLKLLRNEAQLANVIGHEVSHVTERHGVQQFGLGLSAAYGGPKVVSKISSYLKGESQKEFAAGAVGLGLKAITSGYSRKDEFEADRVGQRTAAAAGYDPMGMVDVMTIFKTLEGEGARGIEAYTRSHPYADERMKETYTRVGEIRKYYADRGLPAPDHVGEREYRNFLVNILGVSAQDASKSPITAYLEKDGMLIAGILVVAGASLFLLGVLLK